MVRSNDGQIIAFQRRYAVAQKAFAYLDYALMALKASGGWIDCYDFEHAYKNEVPVGKARVEAEKKLRKLGIRSGFGQRVISSRGSNWHQVVLDVHVIGEVKFRVS